MANRLNYNDLLKYMEIVLDMEKNIYIQQRTLDKMRSQTDRLAIAGKYVKPQKPQKPQELQNPQNMDDNSENMSRIKMSAVALFFLSIVFGGIVYIVFRFGSCIITFDTHTLEPMVCLIIGLVAAVIIYIISIGSTAKGIKKEINIQKDNNLKKYNESLNKYNQNLDKYNRNLNKYNQSMVKDQKRVQRELIQKQYLQIQSDTLATMLRTSRAKLEEIYAYDILEKKYRNMVAVASLYEYLKYEMTRSLQRNGNDEGAYNIYERNIRLDKIITNTDIIIQKLDDVIENQRELADTMKEAKSSIDNLVTSVNNASKQLSGEINNFVTSTNNMSERIQSGMNRLNASVELSNYQQQQTNNELRYMNFMNTLHFYS